MASMSFTYSRTRRNMKGVSQHLQEKLGQVVGSHTKATTSTRRPQLKLQLTTGLDHGRKGTFWSVDTVEPQLRCIIN
ncbi:hypothetical protein Pcinc_013273 [Petrolisthes cinctipes]|uniref:Uncharacterized protein n=1 Tax=Petrolisthes cinctipes TaxID=88211 RepID=A0AAE1FX91_PETCI|nr:hypothetical protein Pcinc_013273 [Petrolisthes cinctipes]